MIVALTGTPGTGKTTVSGLIPYRVIDLNELIQEIGLYESYDEKRDTLIVDEEKMSTEVGQIIRELKDDVVVVEGHLAHHIPSDLIIVLRAHPRVLIDRLQDRGYSESKIRENAEAEALDVILVEALEENENVQEVDTTDKTPSEVAEIIKNIIEGGTKYPYGKVDWSEFLIE